MNRSVPATRKAIRGDTAGKEVPFVKIDKSLNTYDNDVLFPEKLTKANTALENTNLKEILSKKR
ncbi:MAG: hypothetical protein ABI921_02340 [Panacibacter sp.]